eukprot:8975848-Karenia_brevis.AAC.1
MQRWLQGMKGHKWGDNIAVQALADELQRPIIIWRVANPDQLPTCVPHSGMTPETPVQAIYLFLNERRRGGEHYNAGIRTAQSASSASNAQHDLPSRPVPSKVSVGAAAANARNNGGANVESAV